MTFGERLKQVIDGKGITPYELALQTGVSQATLSRILGNVTAKPSLKTAEILAEYLQVNRTWLLSGEGEMLRSGQLQTQEQSGTGVPFYDIDVTCGITESFADVREEPQFRINYAPLNDCDAAFPVYGDSMEPDYLNGDILLVQSTPTIEVGEVGVFTLNGDGYVKELGEGELLSRNPEYDPIPIHESDSLQCWGRVIGKTELV